MKHEYIGGVVYAMSGATNLHNVIAMNTIEAFLKGMQGDRCRVYNSDTKVRVRFPDHTRFYYPDVQVICRPVDLKLTFLDEPTLIVEVVSPSSHRTDRQEKRDAYLSVNSVHVYIILEQNGVDATVWRRTSSGFKQERYVGLKSVVPLPEIGAVLPLVKVYRDATFPAEADAEE